MISFKFQKKIILIILIHSALVAQALRIDHTCTLAELIPDSIIAEIQEEYRIIHGHLSHGWQIDGGLDSLEAIDSRYAAKIGNYELPNQPNSLNVFYYYAGYGSFWYGGGINTLRGYLNKNQSINVALFSWCRDLDEFSLDMVIAYLDSFQVLEDEYPNIKFIYSTGNAQKSGEFGYNRYTNNQYLRTYCESGGKILFDFADLDCWWFDPDTDMWTDSHYIYNETVNIPVENPRFHYDIWHHTIPESGIQKAKAVWWLLAKLAGWEADSSTVILSEDKLKASGFLMIKNYPNPFNPSTILEIKMSKPDNVHIAIYDILGRNVHNYRGFQSGDFKYTWNASGRASGLYFYQVKAGNNIKTGKMLLVE